MNKLIEINKEFFVEKVAKRELYPNKQVRNLSDCYAKPSIIKQNIYDGWLVWVQQVNRETDYILKNFTIDSFNSMMFTLSIDVYTSSDDFIGKIYITKTRQEFWIA